MSGRNDSTGQYAKTILMIDPQDVAGAGATDTASGDFIDIKDYVAFSIDYSAFLTATKTAICTVLQASDAAGTGKTLVSGFSETLTGPTGNGGVAGTIDIEPSALVDADSTKRFIGVRITTNQNGNDIACTMKAWPRYSYNGITTQYDNRRQS